MKENHPDIKFGKTGVLLINLGTPDSTSWWDIRKYLKEFLSDRRVIEVNPILWQIILNLFIGNWQKSHCHMEVSSLHNNFFTFLNHNNSLLVMLATASTTEQRNNVPSSTI